MLSGAIPNELGKMTQLIFLCVAERNWVDLLLNFFFKNK